ncbi:holo-ACP synthase [Bifidobacterium angulatum]|uniref:holo-ACP synthase n=1 Tax=Bifidobacterium angulatum TaxID=1683 RepID=UPI00321B3919
MSLMGLGHDVVDISGFSQQLNEPGARLRALFSTRELRQAALRARMKHDDESLHLAARWAGKEAVLKAWCEAIAQLPRHTNAGEENARAGEYPYTLDDFPWREVEILDDSRGCPRVVLSAKASTALTDSLGVNEPGPGQNRMPVFHVSLSHDGSVASAVVILQMEDRPETDGI